LLNEYYIDQTSRSHIGVGQKKFKVPIVEKSSSYCWAINEQYELCLNFFPDENFLSDETSFILFQVEKLFH
jgi:hypothetical protein